MGILNCSNVCCEKVVSENASLPEECYESINLINKKEQIEKNENYLNYIKKFEEQMKNLGKYKEPEEFDKIIPEEGRKYMTENVLDLSQYLTNNKESYPVKPLEFKNGNIYHGNWNDKFVFDGPGKYYLSDNNIFIEGIWDNGSIKFGRIFYPNNDFYEGQFKNSQFNGKGKLILSNGEVYKGDFDNGEKTGKGIITYKDGTEYSGDIFNGDFKGHGIMRWNNGVEYNGNFEGSSLSGYGELTNKLGDKYEGNFKKNLFEGKGIYSFPDGSSYCGDFFMGIKNGKGVYKRNDGFEYDGNWSNDKPNGFGKVFYDDNIIKCVWRNGKIIEDPTFEKRSINNFNNEILNFKTDEIKLNPKILPHLKSYENNNEFVPVLSDLLNEQL